MPCCRRLRGSWGSVTTAIAPWITKEECGLACGSTAARTGCPLSGALGSPARNRRHPADLAATPECSSGHAAHPGKTLRRMVHQHHLVARMPAHCRAAAPGHQPDRMRVGEIRALFDSFHTIVAVAPVPPWRDLDHQPRAVL